MHYDAKLASSRDLEEFNGQRLQNSGVHVVRKKKKHDQNRVVRMEGEERTSLSIHQQSSNLDGESSLYKNRMTPRELQ